MEGMALFSDDIRDGIKGSVFKAREQGYVNGDGKGCGSYVSPDSVNSIQWDSRSPLFGFIRCSEQYVFTLDIKHNF